MNSLLFIRPLMRAAYRLRRAYWRWRGKTIHGVIALPLTADNKIILIRQTYTAGWGLPGGGRRKREDPVDAAIRELQDEIGITRWSSARSLGSLSHRVSGVPAKTHLVRVDGVEFAFRPSLEIEAAASFARDDLPADLKFWSAGLIR